MKLLNIIDNILDSIEKSFVLLSFTLMLFFSFFTILFRMLYVRFDIQWANTAAGYIDWGEPFARLMVLWVAFLGASLLTKDSRHIKIDIMGHLLPPLLNKIREIILSLGCITVCCIMIKASAGYIKVEMQYSSGSFLNVPIWIYQLIIPFGFSSMTLRFIISGIRQALSPVKKEAAT